MLKYVLSYVKYVFSGLLNTATIIPTAYLAVSSMSANPTESLLLVIVYYVIISVCALTLFIGLLMTVFSSIAIKWDGFSSKNIDDPNYVSAGLSLLTISLFSFWLTNLGVISFWDSTSKEGTIEHQFAMSKIEYNSLRTDLKKTTSEMHVLISLFCHHVVNDKKDEKLNEAEVQQCKNEYVKKQPTSQ